jgi:hypothetical protein
MMNSRNTLELIRLPYGIEIGLTNRQSMRSCTGDLAAIHTLVNFDLMPYMVFTTLGSLMLTSLGAILTMGPRIDQEGWSNRRKRRSLHRTYHTCRAMPDSLCQMIRSGLGRRTTIE